MSWRGLRQGCLKSWIEEAPSISFSTESGSILQESKSSLTAKKHLVGYPSHSSSDNFVLRPASNHPDCYYICLLRSLQYWFCPESNDQVTLQHFPNRDETGPKDSSNSRSPNIWKLYETDGILEIQDTLSGRWLQVAGKKQRNIILVQDKTSGFRFFPIIKMTFCAEQSWVGGFWRTGKRFLSKVRPIGVIVSERASFYMILKNDYILLQSVATGCFLTMENRVLQSKEKSQENASKFRFVGNPALWNIYVQSSDNPDVYCLLEMGFKKITTGDTKISSSEISRVHLVRAHAVQLHYLPRVINRGDEKEESETREVGALFGMSLETVNIEAVWDLLSQSFEFLEEHLISTNSLYMPGSKDLLTKLHDLLNSRMNLNRAIMTVQKKKNSPIVSPCEVIGVLTSYFQALPKPLLTVEWSSVQLIDVSYSDVHYTLESGTETLHYYSIHRNIIRNLLANMNELERSVLQRYTSLLSNLMKTNNISAASIADVFLPSLLQSPPPASIVFPFKCLLLDTDAIFALPLIPATPVINTPDNDDDDLTMGFRYK